MMTRPEQPLDGRRVARRLQDRLVLGLERASERENLLVQEFEAPLDDDLSVLQDRDLGERAVDVHSNDSHAPSPSVSGSWRACTTSTDPRSQRNRAGRRGGHVTTRARSSWSGRPAAVSRSRRPGPVLGAYPLTGRRPARTAASMSIMPFNNAAEQRRRTRPARYRSRVVILPMSGRTLRSASAGTRSMAGGFAASMPSGAPTAMLFTSKRRRAWWRSWPRACSIRSPVWG